MLYKIAQITDTVGRDKTDERSQRRLGREGYIQECIEGSPLVFCYADDLCSLRTTPVTRIVKTERGIAVRTRHTVYWFEALEDDPEAPELVDWEEAD